MLKAALNSGASCAWAAPARASEPSAASSESLSAVIIYPLFCPSGLGQRCAPWSSAKASDQCEGDATAEPPTEWREFEQPSVKLLLIRAQGPGSRARRPVPCPNRDAQRATSGA